MKLSVGSLFRSKKNKNPTRSLSRRSTRSFGSGSSSDESSTRTVLPPSPLSDPFKILIGDLEAVLRRFRSDPVSADEEELMSAAIAETDLESIGSGPVDGSELRDAFDTFDADRNGKISAEELLEVFISLGDTGCNLEECERMIRAVDSDGDGFVGFQDFVRMMELDGQR